MSTKRKSTSTYVRVGPNIYRDGSAYRARVSVNGTRFSRNCSSKTEAVQWRNAMLADQD